MGFAGLRTVVHNPNHYKNLTIVGRLNYVRTSNKYIYINSMSAHCDVLYIRRVNYKILF